MNQKPSSPQSSAQSEALYEYIKGNLSPEDTRLPQDAAQTADLVRSAAQEAGPAPEFAAHLQVQLLQSAEQFARQNPAETALTLSPSERIRNMFKSLSDPFRALAWTALVAGLLIGLIWIIQNTLPKPPEPAYEIGTGTPEGIIVATPTVETISPSPLPPTGLPTPTATNVYQRASGQQVVLSVPLPSAPAELMIYRQILPGPLTGEAVRQKAAQMGLQGHIYLTTSSASGELAYIVIEGGRGLQFNDSIESFTYTPNRQNYPFPSITAGAVRPEFSQQKLTAESYLNSLGLLNFLYQVEPPQGQGDMLHFQPLLEQIPLNANMMQGPAGVQVYFDDQGEIIHVNVNAVTMEPVSALPIRSAQEAFEALLSNSDGPGTMEYSWTDDEPIQQASHWSRRYPTGQRVELYGTADILQPAEAGIAPYVSIHGIPLTGDIQALADQAEPWQEFRAWGQVSQDEQGFQTLVLDGWEVSPLVSTAITGTIRRQGETATLVAIEGTYTIPDLPASITDGLVVNVSGVAISQTLQWSLISTYEGSFGSGGGGGGGYFLPVVFTPQEASTPEPSATPEPLPYADGEQVEGIAGKIWAIVIKKADGSQTANISISFPEDENHPDGWQAVLEGPGSAGLEAYSNLPMRIWGTFHVKDERSFVISVERYEEVYPGLRIQAWKGTWQAITLEGKPAAQFTSDAGEIFIIENYDGFSLEDLQGQIDSMGKEIIIAGYAYPDRKIGGYPTIKETGIAPASMYTNTVDFLDNMQLMHIIPEEDMISPDAKIIVEKVELIYYITTDPFDEAASPYAQPIWLFSGHYENGQAFEIYVQAVADEYLQR